VTTCSVVYHNQSCKRTRTRKRDKIIVWYKPNKEIGHAHASSWPRNCQEGVRIRFVDHLPMPNGRCDPGNPHISSFLSPSMSITLPPVPTFPLRFLSQLSRCHSAPLSRQARHLTPSRSRTAAPSATAFANRAKKKKENPTTVDYSSHVHGTRSITLALYFCDGHRSGRYGPGDGK
jgi:hypothetical protein